MGKVRVAPLAEGRFAYCHSGSAKRSTLELRCAKLEPASQLPRLTRMERARLKNRLDVSDALFFLAALISSRIP